MKYRTIEKVCAVFWLFASVFPFFYFFGVDDVNGTLYATGIVVGILGSIILLPFLLWCGFCLSVAYCMWTNKAPRFLLFSLGLAAFGFFVQYFADGSLFGAVLLPLAVASFVTVYKRGGRSSYPPLFSSLDQPTTSSASKLFLKLAIGGFLLIFMPLFPVFAIPFRFGADIILWALFCFFKGRELNLRAESQGVHRSLAPLVLFVIAAALALLAFFIGLAFVSYYSSQ